MRREQKCSPFFLVKVFSNKSPTNKSVSAKVRTLFSRYKECFANALVPFIITEELKFYYYRDLKEWGKVNGYLTDTCLAAQDTYKAALDYFKIRF